MAFKQHNPPHPGEFFKEVYLAELGLTLTEAARRLKVDKGNLSRFARGQIALTPDMARRLERVFGGSAESWMNKQSVHALWQEEQKEDLAELEPL